MPVPHIWTVQARSDENERWHDVLVTKRFVDAMHTYDDTEDPKRLLRDGRALRLNTTPEELDLFHEGGTT